MSTEPLDFGLILQDATRWYSGRERDTNDRRAGDPRVHPGVGTAINAIDANEKGYAMKRNGKLLMVLCCLGAAAVAEAQSASYCADYARREADYAAPTGRGMVRGGARGAAGGALFGAIAGDAGTGAAVGAIVGGVAGGARNRSTRDQVYNDAYNACMRGQAP